MFINSNLKFSSETNGLVLKPQFNKYDFHYNSNSDEQAHIYRFLNNMKDEENQVFNEFITDDTNCKYKPFMTHVDCKLNAF